MNYDRILPALIVGACPESLADLQRLKQQEGVTAVLNLQTDADLRLLGLDPSELEAWYAAAGLAGRRAPVRDLDSQDLRARLADCVRALDELLEAGHRVYLHCTAGAGRSPGVAVAWLVWRKGWTIEQAYAWVTQRRPSSPDMAAIRAAIARCAEW